MVAAVGLACLFVALHFNFFQRMYRIGLHRFGGDWSHAVAIPFISAYFVYKQRDRLRRLPREVYWPGMLVLLGGIFAYAASIYPIRNDMLQGYSMIVALFGLVLLLLGPRMMTVLWFPIAYLALGVKVSQRIWYEISWQLQLVAAKASAVALNFLGLFLDISATVRGATIDVMHRGQLIEPPLNVEHACSGLRMLMAFIALGAAMAFLREYRPWQRAAMVLLTVPIAVLVNVGRVTALGLAHVFAPDLTTGVSHTWIGMLMLIPAAGLFWLVGWMLEHIVIYDEQAEPTAVSRQHLPRRGVRVSQQAVGKACAAGLATAAAVEALAWVAGRAWWPEAELHAWHRLMPRLLTTFSAGLVFGLLAFGGFTGSRWVRAAIGGAALPGAAGLGLFALIALVRPDRFAAGHETAMQAAAVVLLVCSAAALVAGLFELRRTAARAQRDGPSGNAAAISLVTATLLVAAVGVAGLVQTFRIVLVKQPLELRHAFNALPKEVGGWQLDPDRQPPPLDPEVVQTLGTTQYINRNYVYVDPETRATIHHLRLHIAYYTGTPDTTPHVPERCFVAGGLQGVRSTTVGLALDRAAVLDVGDETLARASLEPLVRLPLRDDGSIPATVFTFADAAGENMTNVVYFFSVNGRFMPTPEDVRFNGINIRDRYAYYCKIEVLVERTAKAAQAVAVAEQFLSAMLPEIMACLPDWEVANGAPPATTNAVVSERSDGR